MSTTGEIINKVAQSPLVSLDLEDYYQHGERVVVDMKDWLYEEIILKEKDFRAAIKEHDWSQYQNKYVALTCSADAIIPTWAYMLITVKLVPYASYVHQGTLQELEKAVLKAALDKIDPLQFREAKVVIKGCGHLSISEFAYVEITKILFPVVSSIMYGEPCSTVPVFKVPPSAKK